MKVPAVKTLKPLIFLAAATIASTSAAQTVGKSPKFISYDYIGAQYVSQNLDDFDCTQDGINLYGSLDITDGWFGQASITDVSGGGCGSSTISVLGGYRQSFNEIFYWFAKVGFDQLSVDGPGGDDSGLAIAGGLRGFIKENLEATLELSTHTVGDGNTMISGTGAYFFKSNFAGTVNLGLSGDVTQIAIGARFNF